MPIRDDVGDHLSFQTPLPRTDSPNLAIRSQQAPLMSA